MVPDIRSVVRENLGRSVPFAMRDEPDGDGRTLDGYGAVFDAETVIDSWEGTFRESISRGAFRRTLRERTPKMQFDHGRHPLIGSIPIGVFDDGSPAEDQQGLHVVGRLMDNWLIQPVRDAIAAGSIDGMSFRFSVVRETWTTAGGERVTDPRQIAEWIWKPPAEGMLLRTLTEVKLSEVGPVVWPAYAETSVGVRSGTIDLGRLHEPATRRLLAEAVLMADVADGERMRTARPRASASEPVDHSPGGAPVGSVRAPGGHRSPDLDISGDEGELRRRAVRRERLAAVRGRMATLEG
jgi:HK97 family phage prohead protease